MRTQTNSKASHHASCENTSSAVQLLGPLSDATSQLLANALPSSSLNGSSEVLLSAAAPILCPPPVPPAKSSTLSSTPPHPSRRQGGGGAVLPLSNGIWKRRIVKRRRSPSDAGTAEVVVQRLSIPRLQEAIRQDAFLSRWRYRNEGAWSALDAVRDKRREGESKPSLEREGLTKEENSNPTPEGGSLIPQPPTNLTRAAITAASTRPPPSEESNHTNSNAEDDRGLWHPSQRRCYKNVWSTAVEGGEAAQQTSRGTPSSDWLQQCRRQSLVWQCRPRPVQTLEQALKSESELFLLESQLVGLDPSMRATEKEEQSEGEKDGAENPTSTTSSSYPRAPRSPCMSTLPHRQGGVTSLVSLTTNSRPNEDVSSPLLLEKASTNVSAAPGANSTRIGEGEGVCNTPLVVPHATVSAVSGDNPLSPPPPQYSAEDAPMPKSRSGGTSRPTALSQTFLLSRCEESDETLGRSKTCSRSGSCSNKQSHSSVVYEISSSSRSSSSSEGPESEEGDSRNQRTKQSRPGPRYRSSTTALSRKTARTNRRKGDGGGVRGKSTVHSNKSSNDVMTSGKEVDPPVKGAFKSAAVRPITKSSSSTPSPPLQQRRITDYLFRKV